MTAGSAAMLADMHCHYPMHVVARDPKGSLGGSPNLTVEAMTRVSRRPGWLEKLRAAALRAAANHLNYGDDRWRVSLAGLRRGEVGAVFSVLYDPFAEFDLGESYGAPPERGYFGELIEQLELVEADLREVDPEGRAHEL